MSEDHEPQPQPWTTRDTMAVVFFVGFVFFLIVWILYKMTEV